jgi:signal transduction histidine kinase
MAMPNDRQAPSFLALAEVNAMPFVPRESILNGSNFHLLVAYVADLELEVDRLRKQSQFVQQEAWETLKRIHLLTHEAGQNGDGSAALLGIGQASKELAAVLHDLPEVPGYHPAHDQVVAIAVRPLAEQVFRGQQRLIGVPHATLRLELECEHVEWFPARFRHILDNLISNALKYSDASKDEVWVKLGLRVLPDGYELRVSDNGLGLPMQDRAEIFELLYRAGPARTSGLGVGLAVVKLLVEQSGGKLTVASGDGQGTSFVIILPQYDMDDFLI